MLQGICNLNHHPSYNLLSCMCKAIFIHLRPVHPVRVFDLGLFVILSFDVGLNILLAGMS